MADFIIDIKIMKVCIVPEDHRVHTVIFCLGVLVLLGALMEVLTLPLISATFPTNNVTMDRNSANLSGIQERNETCSTWIGIALEEGSENDTDISCLQKVLGECRPFDVSLGYILGSMRVSIKGAIIDGGACSLNLEYEIERGQTNMTCMIPLVKMSSWTNWKRGDGYDAIEQISKYCSVQ